MSRLVTLIAAVVAAAAVTYSLVCFQVDETEQALVLQFGRPVKTVLEPGLNYKTPFLQNVVYFKKYLMEYDASPRELITIDKQQLLVDNFSRWRITDPLTFYQTVVSISSAQSRLDDIIYSNLREAIGKRTLTDIVSGDRTFMQAVTEQSNERVKAYGVEIVDIRIKRTDLPEKNEQAVFSRMRSERERLAKKFRAEGEEESRKIRSQAERDRQILLAEAEREADVIRGEAEAKATAIYAAAHNRDPEFYKFMRTLDAYRKTLDKKTKLVLNPDSEFLRLLKDAK